MMLEVLKAMEFQVQEGRGEFRDCGHASVGESVALRDDEFSEEESAGIREPFERFVGECAYSLQFERREKGHFAHFEEILEVDAAAEFEYGEASDVGEHLEHFLRAALVGSVKVEGERQGEVDSVGPLEEREVFFLERR